MNEPGTDPLAEYPYRCAHCAYCQEGLRKDGPEEPWVDAWGGRECEQAPNPDEGPMPNHKPGSAVLRRPAPEPKRYADPATLPKPVVPWIPRNLG